MGFLFARDHLICWYCCLFLFLKQPQNRLRRCRIFFSKGRLQVSTKRQRTTFSNISTAVAGTQFSRLPLGTLSALRNSFCQLHHLFLGCVVQEPVLCRPKTSPYALSMLWLRVCLPSSSRLKTLHGRSLDFLPSDEK